MGCSSRHDCHSRPVGHVLLPLAEGYSTIDQDQSGAALLLSADPTVFDALLPLSIQPNWLDAVVLPSVSVTLPAFTLEPNEPNELALPPLLACAIQPNELDVIFIIFWHTSLAVPLTVQVV